MYLLKQSTGTVQSCYFYIVLHRNVQVHFIPTEQDNSVVNLSPELFSLFYLFYFQICLNIMGRIQDPEL